MDSGAHAQKRTRRRAALMSGRRRMDGCFEPVTPRRLFAFDRLWAAARLAGPPTAARHRLRHADWRRGMCADAKGRVGVAGRVARDAVGKAQVAMCCMAEKRVLSANFPPPATGFKGWLKCLATRMAGIRNSA